MREGYRELAELIAARVDRERRLPEAAWEQGVGQIEAAIRDRFGSPHLPRANESVAVAFHVPKTAALYFDRVWSSPAYEDAPPADIRVWGATEFEVHTQAALLALERQLWVDEEELAADLMKLASAERWQNPLERSIAIELTTKFQAPCVPVYQSRATRDEQYRPGRIDLIVATVTALELVDESVLTWEQVVEFRRDREARAKYRRFVHWLDTELVERPVTFIADEVAARMSDYEWSMKKHGIKTAIGSLSSLLDPAFIAASSAAVTSAAIAADGRIAALTGIGITIGRAVLSIGSALVDLADERRKWAEIAYAYDLKAKLNAPAA